MTRNAAAISARTTTPWTATSASISSSTAASAITSAITETVPTPRRLRRQSGAEGVAPKSDDLEVPLQFPVGHGVLPLAPLPLARGGVVVDELVTEPIARHIGLAEDA